MNDMIKCKVVFTALALLGLYGTVAAAPVRDSIWVENKHVLVKQGKVAIDLSFPQLDSERGDEALVGSVNRTVIQTLASELPVESKVPVQTVDQLRLYLVSQVSEIEKKVSQMPGVDAVPFQFYSTWSAFGNPNVVSIYLQRYLFMGGAHGATHCSYMNFDPKTGKQIDLRQFIPDTAAFLDIVAERFCKERRLPKDALQLQTGLFCELSDLPMPKQMGFSDKGLVVLYNQYEIAPYSFGQIVITIPFKMFADKWGGLLEKMRSQSGGKKSFDTNTTRRDADLWRK